MVGRILYNNLLRSAAATGETTASGFPSSQALDGRTTTFCKLPSGTTQLVTWDFGSVKTFDSLAFARHSFDDNTNINLRISSNGVDWTDIVTTWVPDTTGKNIFIDLGSQSYRYVRLAITDLTKDMTFADVFIGPSYNLDRSQKHGFIRPGLSDGDTIESNVTRGQELAGITLRRGVEKITYRLHYYSSNWLGEFLSLKETMKQYPVYIIWDTSRAEVPFQGNGGEPAFYCWPDGKLPEPRYSKSINGYYDIVMKMEGFYR